MLRYFLSVLLILFTVNSFSQGFQKLFNSANSNQGDAVQQTFDGGYITSGHSSPLGSLNASLLKTDSSGNMLWFKRYQASGGDDAFMDVIQTPDSGYMAVGRTENFGNGSMDIWLVRTDALGDTLWTKTIGGTGFDRALSIEPTSDGGYIIAGQMEDLATNGAEMALVKTNANGDTLWTRKYGGTNFDFAHTVSQTQDGGYIVAGVTASFGTGDEDIYLVRADMNGDTLWTRYYGGPGPGWDTPYAVHETSSGFVIGARTNSFTSGYDISLIATDTNGDMLWEQNYGGNNNEFLHEAIMASDGGFMLCGETETYGPAPGRNAYALKTDALGNIDWAKSYGGILGSYFYGLASNSNSGYIFSGTRNAATGSDLYLVKTDSTGVSGACYESDETFGFYTPGYQFGPAGGDVTSGTGVSTSAHTVNTPIVLLDSLQTLTLNFTIVDDQCGGVCVGQVTVLPVGGVSPYTYSWNTTPPSFVPSITGQCAGTYVVDVTDNDGCSTIDSVQIQTAAPVTDICMITVDSTSRKNIIMWEKPQVSNIDSFKVYRNIIGNYVHIGTVDYDSLSEFTDTTNGINPFITSYRYVLSTVDTCGNESAFSSHHETMHLTANQGLGNEVNLIWFAYTGFSFSYYRIMRDSTGTGNFVAIDSVLPSNFTYTDLNPPTDSARYIIEIVHPNACVVTRAAGNNNTSRSNEAELIGGGNGIEDFEQNLYLQTYPNPNDGSLSISFELQNPEEVQLKISDVRGRLVYSENWGMLSGKTERQVQLSELDAGVYLLQLITEQYTAKTRIVVK